MQKPQFLRLRASICVPIALMLAAGVADAGRRERPAGGLEPSTTYAAFVMSRVADAAGFEAPPEIYRAPVVAAHAVLVRGREAIVYNPGFLEGISHRAGTPWAAVSVIAHELGHHYYGHSHTPVETLPPDVLREHELEADYFSGFVLARMGASCEDAEAAQQTLFARADSATHPDSYRRLAAISAGWNDGTCDAAPAADPAARVAGIELERTDVSPAHLARGTDAGSPFPSGLW